MIFFHIIFLLSLDPDPQDAHYEGLFSQENVIVDNSSIISPVAIGCVTVYNYSRKIPVSCKGFKRQKSFVLNNSC